ncbi:hypothetical protein GE061_016405 [Apolygus lucorum]|uniref:Uncharacterized protein n=1 Tax=Apolygus lucorum TaxID=248454 RepID=A0A6A4JW94_APOLU|nr:hypothetical protein GE061_016405 [Apolygus lucorum]
MDAMMEKNVFTGLRRRVQSGNKGNLSSIDHLRVCIVLQDFIYFDFWAFFLLLTPMYALKALGYVTEKGVIYVAPYVIAFGMIYFKSLIHVKNWVMKKWTDYKDF